MQCVAELDFGHRVDRFEHGLKQFQNPQYLRVREGAQAGDARLALAAYAALALASYTTLMPPKTSRKRWQENCVRRSEGRKYNGFRRFLVRAKSGFQRVAVANAF